MKSGQINVYFIGYKIVKLLINKKKNGYKVTIFDK